MAMSDRSSPGPFPTTIVFGAGAVAHARRPREAHRRQARVLVVCDAGVVKVGIAERVRALLEDGGVAAAVFDKVDPNPVEKNVLRRRRRLQARTARTCIVSVGGGSPLDAGKLIALKVTHDRPLVDYDDATGGDQLHRPERPADHRPSRRPPAPGSEVGRSGVVTLAATGRKTVIFSPYLLAKVALLDPELTRSMPAARHGRHRASTRSRTASRRTARSAITRWPTPSRSAGSSSAREHLVRAVEHGDDLDARGGMMKAAMMGAVAFQKGLGACHSLAHPLSSEKGLHHGLANALCLPAVVDFNERVAHAKLERIRAHPRPEGGDAAATALRALRKRIGLPEGLGAEGVDRGGHRRSSPTRPSRTRATAATRGPSRATISPRSTARRSSRRQPDPSPRSCVRARARGCLACFANPPRGRRGAPEHRTPRKIPKRRPKKVSLLTFFLPKSGFGGPTCARGAGRRACPASGRRCRGCRGCGCRGTADSPSSTDVSRSLASLGPGGLGRGRPTSSIAFASLPAGESSYSRLPGRVVEVPEREDPERLGVLGMKSWRTPSSTLQRGSMYPKPSEGELICVPRRSASRRGARSGRPGRARPRP